MLKQDRTVWAAGANMFGQLGIDSKRYVVPKTMPNFVQVLSSGAKAVAAGGVHSLVLKQDGSVWSTGRNQYGQVGDSSNTDRETFVQVIPSGAKAIAAGGKHSMAVMRDGSVWSTGSHLYGQLGDGTKTDRSDFLMVMTGAAEAAAAGGEHSMVLKQDGSVWVTGNNEHGQLGDGSTQLARWFVHVISVGGKAVAAGGRHSLVLKQGGSVWATGDNEYGQLGDGSTSLKMSFVQVMSGGAKAIAAGSYHSIVLKQDGSVWSTGRNNFGQLGTQLGIGPSTYTSLFVRVTYDKAQAVAGGGWHSILLKRDRSIWATGGNVYGQLGDGTTISKNTFVRVLLSTRSSLLSRDGVWCMVIPLFGSVQLDFVFLTLVGPQRRST